MCIFGGASTYLVSPFSVAPTYYGKCTIAVRYEQYVVIRSTKLLYGNRKVIQRNVAIILVTSPFLEGRVLHGHYY